MDGETNVAEVKPETGDRKPESEIADTPSEVAERAPLDPVPEVKPEKGKRRRAKESAAAVVIDLGVKAEDIAPVLEAVLLSIDRPSPGERLAEGLGIVKPKGSGDEAACDPAELGAGAAVIAEAVKLLNAQYVETHRSFRVESVAGGYRLMTLPAFADKIAEYHKTRVSGKLSRAAVETLAIIAYKQPLTKAALEAIRGVSCGEVLKTLMERRLVTIKGRAEELGRPMLYGTTKQFLDQFGLASIKDLPSPAEFKAGA
ncbi:MAG TPA: SMC-Scp complex subunit ScpB [Phycisphaerales bacterium]|nr:SMC-Scp complex subunit ScpB [Phycisphaerales bacterium]